MSCHGTRGEDRSPGEPSLGLWYELGRVYAGAGGRGWQAARLGFTVACVTGALVLLSGFFFGTAWTGDTAPLLSAAPVIVPVVAGLLAWGVPFSLNRVHTFRRQQALWRRLTELGEDPRRPTAGGLGAYYDAQLVLLRSEYDVLRKGKDGRSRRDAGMLEAAFGFRPEDPFETGPLNVAPDTEGLRSLRRRWEERLKERRERGVESPALGLKEDLAYRVFPREMTVPLELATRGAYLSISCELLYGRYGRKPVERTRRESGELGRRAERDLREYGALTRTPSRRR